MKIIPENAEQNNNDARSITTRNETDSSRPPLSMDNNQPSTSLSVQDIHKYRVKRIQVGGIRYYVCEYCNNKFETLATLNDHHKKTHPALQCDVCNKICLTPYTLVRHFYKHVAKRYRCKLCNETFQFKSEVSQHMFVHMGEAKFN